MTEENIREYQDNIRAATEDLTEQEDGFLNRKLWPGECSMCGRPNNGSYLGICSACRLGPV